MGIIFEKVGYTYIKKSLNLALDNINLEIKKNDEFIFLVGHTGSGKSTLSYHMNALYHPSFGEVNIFGNIIINKRDKKIKYNEIRKKVGLVFQFPEYQLFDESIEKDVSFALRNDKLSKEEVEKIVKEKINQVGLDNSYLNRSPFLISGGEKKRVSLAGILVMNPEVLVLDEPTSGLDPKGRNELMELFKKINEEEHKSIVIISHDMNLVNKYAKRVIVMKKGKIIYDGKPQDLFMKNNLNDFDLSMPSSLKIYNDLNKKFDLGLLSYPKDEKDVINELLRKENE